jgi:hypothetical protein
MPVEIEHRMQKMFSKIKINFSKILRKVDFIFVDDITQLSDWFDNLKNYYLDSGKSDFDASNETYRAQDKYKFDVSTFHCDDKIYISALSFDSQKIENCILRELIRDQFEVSEKVQEMFNDKIRSKVICNGSVFYKKPFISYLAEDSAESYLIESITYYINQKFKLEKVDRDIFDYIKNNIFNS